MSKYNNPKGWLTDPPKVPPTDNKQFMLNARFIMQKQAEEITELRERVVVLESAISRARLQIFRGNIAVADQILAAKEDR